MAVKKKAKTKTKKKKKSSSAPRKAAGTVKNEPERPPPGIPIPIAFLRLTL